MQLPSWTRRFALPSGGARPWHEWTPKEQRLWACELRWVGLLQRTWDEQPGPHAILRCSLQWAMFAQMYPTDAQPEQSQAATNREINGWLFQPVGSVQANDTEGYNQSPSKQRQPAQGHQPGREEPANYLKPAYRSWWNSCQRETLLGGLLVEDMAAGATRHLFLAEELTC